MYRRKKAQGHEIADTRGCTYATLGRYTGLGWVEPAKMYSAERDKMIVRVGTKKEKARSRNRNKNWSKSKGSKKHFKLQ